MSENNIINFPASRPRPGVMDQVCRVDGVLSAAQYYMLVTKDFTAAISLLRAATTAAAQGEVEVELSDREADLINNSDHAALIKALYES